MTGKIVRHVLSHIWRISVMSIKVVPPSFPHMLFFFFLSKLPPESKCGCVSKFPTERETMSLKYECQTTLNKLHNSTYKHLPSVL